MMRKYKLVDRDIESKAECDEYANYVNGITFEPKINKKSIYYCCGVIAAGRKLLPDMLEKHRWYINIFVRYCPSLDSFLALVPYLQKHQHRHKTYLIKRPIPEILDFAAENGIILQGDPESKYSLVIAGREPDDDPTFYYAYADVAARNGQWDKFYEYYNKLSLVDKYRAEIVGHLIERGDTNIPQEIKMRLINGYFLGNLKFAPKEFIEHLLSYEKYYCGCYAKNYRNPDYCRYYFDIPELQRIFDPNYESLKYVMFDKRLHHLIPKIEKTISMHCTYTWAYYIHLYKAGNTIVYNHDFFMFCTEIHNYKYLKNFLLDVDNPEHVKTMKMYADSGTWRSLSEYIKKINPTRHRFIFESTYW